MINPLSNNQQVAQISQNHKMGSVKTKKVEQNRIDTLKEQIQSGNYKIDTKLTAQSMVDAIF